MYKNPAIVVVAYNREGSLRRLLSSLDGAIYEVEVTLLISIDCSGESQVHDTASSFVWRHGEKKVIHHSERQGLRKHVLSCGDMTAEYGSIILLEDDIVVSLYFYEYAIKALEFYSNDKDVAGISLYSHKRNVNCRKRFEPILDGYDVYWLQFASSWGQIWTARHWEMFKAWYVANSKRRLSPNAPAYVHKWPDTSWLKYYISYLIENDLYFVYPRNSLTTNFSDKGSNVRDRDNTYQVNMPLTLGGLSYSRLKDALAVYDSHFELHPKSIPAFLKEYSISELEIDLYGTKNLSTIRKRYLISSKKYNGDNGVKISRSLWPHDLNLFFDLENDEEGGLTLGDKALFEQTNKFRCLDLIYFADSISLADLVKLLVYKFRKKIKKYI